MDIMEEWRNELERANQLHKENYPYGDLDYQQFGDNVNLYFAPLPKSEPLFIDNEGEGYHVFDLIGAIVKIPEMGNGFVLRYWIPAKDLVYAQKKVGNGKVAWQEWEKVFINGEPKYRAKNWIAEGPVGEVEYETICLQLTTGHISNVSQLPSYSNVSNVGQTSLSLVETFASHRASGDQIIKGLNVIAQRRIGESFTNFKITEQFLGGWLIRGQLGSELTVSDFIEYVDRALNVPIR